MINKLSLLFCLLFCIQYISTNGTSLGNAINPVLCEESVKNQYVKFYKENKLTYNLLFDEDELDSLDCYQLLDKSGKKDRNLAWMFFDISGNGSDFKKFIINLYNPQKGWLFLKDAKCPQYAGSLNELINTETDEEKQLRLQNYLTTKFNVPLNELDPEHYSSYFNFMYISNMINLDKVNDAFINVLVYHVIKKNYQYIISNFKDLVAENYTNNITNYSSVLEDKMISCLDNSVKASIVSLVKDDQTKLFETFKKVIGIMESLSNNESYGQDELVSKVNAERNSLDGNDVFQVYNVLYRVIKKQDYIKNNKVVPFKSSHSSPEEIKQMVDEISAYTQEEVKYLFVELFASQGINILESFDKKASMIEMLFYSKNKCALTDVESEALFSYGVKSQWLLPDTVIQNHRTFMRACSKAVEGNVELFNLTINPSGQSRCQIIFRRDLTNEKDPLSIIPDTSELYTYRNSCKRDTDRIKKERASIYII